MVSSRFNFLSYLLLLPTLCLGFSDFSKFKPYPPEANDILNQTVVKLSKKAPKVKVLITMPGKDFFSHLQEVAVRNSYQNHLFDLDVNYIMEDGLKYGCRVVNDGVDTNTTNRITDHSPSNKHKYMCKTHCTHKGRYCPTFTKDELKEQTNHNGYDLVLEVLRRLCLGNLLDGGFAHPTWFRYVSKFQSQDCLGSDKKLSECSGEILKSLNGFPVSAGSAFDKCVKEAEADTDTANPILEDSLDFSHDLKDYTIDQLPVLEIGGKQIDHGIRADKLSVEWCSHFNGNLKPVACDFCHGCNNAKVCLWQLTCGRKHFDVNTYKNPKGNHKNNKHKNHANETEMEIVEDEVEVVAEDVVYGTGIILAAGIGIGVIGSVFLFFLVELKRKRAVAEVAKELPVEGFTDKDDDLELPNIS